MLLLGSAGGIGYWSLLLALVLAFRGSEIWRLTVLADWTADMGGSNVNHYILIYVAITFAQSILGGLRWIWLYGIGKVGMTNGTPRVIHELLLDRLCAAPLHFFESTPIGRLINIVGQDIWKVDSEAAEDVGRECIFGVELTVGGLFQVSTTITASMIICYSQPVSVSLKIIC